MSPRQKTGQRLFIAAPLPPVWTTQIKVWKRRGVLPAMRWQIPEQWHLTLMFLGNIQPEHFVLVQQRTQIVVSTLFPFQLELEGMQVITQGRTNLCWLAFKLSTEFIQTVHTLQCVFAEPPLCVPIEKRPPRPHITLARGQGRHHFLLPANSLGLRTTLFPIDTVCLYESFLQPDHSVYRVHEAYILDNLSAQKRIR